VRSSLQARMMGIAVSSICVAFRRTAVHQLFCGNGPDGSTGLVRGRLHLHIEQVLNGAVGGGGIPAAIRAMANLNRSRAQTSGSPRILVAAVFAPGRPGTGDHGPIRLVLEALEVMAAR